MSFPPVTALAAALAMALPLAPGVSTESQGLAAGETASTTEAPRAEWRQELPADKPPGLYGSGLAFDSSTGVTVLFGGVANDVLDEDETWTWDGEAWTQVRPRRQPRGRDGAAMAYDPVRDEVILFGGTGYFGDFADTWAYKDGVWTRRHPANAPLKLVKPAMAFDPHLQQLVLFGGWRATRHGPVDATWTWDGSTWKKLHPATSPTPRNNAEMAYDPIRDALVLYGGRDDNFTVIGDTWVWDGTTWIQENPTLSPGPRQEYGMATLGEHVVLYGGISSGIGSPEAGDTWILLADTWKQVSSQPAPPARRAPALEWDSARGEAVMFGGVEQGRILKDTWTLTP